MADSFLDLGEPVQPVRPEVYRVLARKYRPSNFNALIGQDAMVTTLANAIKRGRLAHAFLLTGVRGVGKTSTARLIAKALNCIGTDGQGGPTIDPCGVCEPCRAIAEGRHIDVLEQDAASNTKVEQMRELLDSVPYSPVSARFKIYIMDEVHMLSNASFNALLKTLEEPPPHVKFIFATTEIAKVPVTVLSRCQRFDLRRIPADKLGAHFAAVVAAEGVEAEPEALALIARAAEGSARDGLSILDQAIAHAGMEGGGIRADAVRAMLGLSDRGAIRDLLGLLLKGDGLGALASLRQQYTLGVDPQSVLRSLLEAVHGVTLAKLGTDPDPAQSNEERGALAEWAGALSFATLHRLWQLLLKGHDEVARAALPIEACEMALLRVVHAATLPDPGELARHLGGAVPMTQPVSVSHAAAAKGAPPSPATASAPLPATFAELLTFLDNHREIGLAEKLRLVARVVHYDPPLLTLSSAKPVPADLARELTDTLRRLTGTAWRVALEDTPGAPSVKESEAAIRAAELEQIKQMPIVAAAFQAFPGAEITGWTLKERSMPQ